MQTADFTIADVLAWARTKPAGETYTYVDSRNCAICRFLKDTGRCADPGVLMNFWWDRSDKINGGRQVRFDDPIRECANNSNETFGALVARLEALCPETVVTPNEWTQLDAYLTDIEDVARERCSA